IRRKPVPQRLVALVERASDGGGSSGPTGSSPWPAFTSDDDIALLAAGVGASLEPNGSCVWRKSCSPLVLGLFLSVPVATLGPMREFDLNIERVLENWTV